MLHRYSTRTLEEKHEVNQNNHSCISIIENTEIAYQQEVIILSYGSQVYSLKKKHVHTYKTQQEIKERQIPFISSRQNTKVSKQRIIFLWYVLYLGSQNSTKWKVCPECKIWQARIAGSRTTFYRIP